MSFKVFTDHSLDTSKSFQSISLYFSISVSAVSSSFSCSFFYNLSFITVVNIVISTSIQYI